MCELLRQLKNEKKSLEISELTLPCRFHKRVRERFTFSNIYKGFRCPELFHSIYPKVLALMYDARLSQEELVMNCPNSKNKVCVRLYTKPLKLNLRRFLNKVKEFLRPIKAMDVVNCTVYGKVISVQGHCLAAYKTQDTFEICYTDTICPQALYSILPTVLLSKGDSLVCQCPSNVNKVVFRKINYD